MCRGISPQIPQTGTDIGQAIGISFGWFNNAFKTESLLYVAIQEKRVKIS